MALSEEAWKRFKNPPRHASPEVDPLLTCGRKGFGRLALAPQVKAPELSIQQGKQQRKKPKENNEKEQPRSCQGENLFNLLDKVRNQRMWWRAK